MARKEIPRELSIYINDKAVVNSLAGITREISRTNNEMRNLNRNSETYTEDMATLRGNLANLTEQQAEFRNEIRNTSEAMDEGTGSFSKFKDGLLSGDFESAKAGLLGIKAQMAGLVTTSLAFIATPIGLAITALAGIAYATKQWYDYNESIKESTRLIENLTGKTGQAVADIRNNVQALSDTFKVEFKDLANAVDNLMDTGVAKDELEALDKIKNGLLTAPDANEFIASLESTALVAKQVGMDLEEVIALKQEIEDTGIDPEKTFGALQKASKSLAEQSDALKIKLTDALGSAFTNDVLNKIKSGEITTVQALTAIGEKSKEVGLNQKQQADLTTALFGKAGIAAGGLETITNSLTNAQRRQTAELTPLQKATQELADSQIDLKTAQDDLLRSEGFEEWKTSLLVNFNQVKKGFYDLIYEITNGFGSVEDKIKATAESQGLQQYANDSIKTFEDYAERRKKSMGAMYDFEKVKEEHLSSLRQSLSNASGFDATEEQQEQQKRFEAAIDAVRVYKGKEKEINKKATDDEIRDASEAFDKKKKLDDDAKRAKEKARQDEKTAQEKAAKEELDRYLALAKAKADLAKAEINFFIANNKTKIDSTKALTPEIIAEEENRLRTIQDKQLLAIDEENVEKAKKAAADAKSAEELAAIIETIGIDYETKRIELIAQTDAQILANKNTLAEQDKQLKAEQLVADNELALMEATNKFDADRIKQKQDYDAQIADYKDLLNRKIITKAEFDKFEAAANKQQDEINRQRQFAQTQEVLGGLNTLAGALGEMFGQSKELAIVQANISGAQAVLSIWAAPSALPQPFDSILKGVLTAATVIQTASQIKTITKQKAPKKPKFFDGGHTGSYAVGYDQYGKIVGDVHEEEYVIPKAMTQSPRYANTIAWLEAERTGKKTGKFADGGPSSTNVIPETVMAENDSEMKGLMRALLHRLDNPVSPILSVGYNDAKAIQDLNNERASSEQNATVNE